MTDDVMNYWKQEGLESLIALYQDPASADPFHATGSSRGQSVTEQPPLKFGRARKQPEPEMVPFPRRAAE